MLNAILKTLISSSVDTITLTILFDKGSSVVDMQKLAYRAFEANPDGNKHARFDQRG
jgi:hypothetical protein